MIATWFGAVDTKEVPESVMIGGDVVLEADVVDTVAVLDTEVLRSNVVVNPVVVENVVSQDPAMLDIATSFATGR